MRLCSTYKHSYSLHNIITVVGDNDGAVLRSEDTDGIGMALPLHGHDNRLYTNNNFTIKENDTS
jgi:hypothetical protein